MFYESLSISWFEQDITAFNMIEVFVHLERRETLLHDSDVLVILRLIDHEDRDRQPGQLPEVTAG